MDSEHAGSRIAVDGPPIGIVGAGTMGSGIAIAFANAGYAVVVVDAAADGLERSRTSIAANYATQMAKGRIDAPTANERKGRITHSQDLKAVAGSPLVIEAIFESLELKQAIFFELGGLCSPDAILATNTSTLDVDAIAQAAAGPQRCLGMHFFSPAHIMKLVEVVRSRHSAQAVIGAVCALAREIGKTPVVVGNADGFVGNRMLLGYRREAEFMVLSGAEPRDVDAALEAFGFAMGPFAVADLAGIDIGVRAKRERAERGEAPAFRLTNVSDKLVEAGRLGRKTAKGFYHYEAGSGGTDTIDEELAAIISAERARLTIVPHPVRAEEIVERCVLALVNEGARLVSSGIADSMDDVDSIWRLGYGFPAARGGPMEYAASLGYARVVERIAAFSRDDPLFWTIAPLLQRLAQAADTPTVGQR